MNPHHGAPFFLSALPRSLEVNALVGTTGAAARQGLYPRCYGRLDARGQFRTIVSRINPSHRQGEVLHPNVRIYCSATPTISLTTDFRS